MDAPISERTLQRDINDIEMLFHIEISFDRATNSYRINERFSSREDRLSEMLLNFELLNAVDESPNTRSDVCKPVMRHNTQVAVSGHSHKT